jgi:hypothetical protein
VPLRVAFDRSNISADFGMTALNQYPQARLGVDEMLARSHSIRNATISPRGLTVQYKPL